MFTIAFWKQTAERAAKSAAQAPLVGAFFSNTGPVNAFKLDWALGLGLAAGGAIVSILTSIVSAPIAGEPDSPSLVDV